MFKKVQDIYIDYNPQLLIQKGAFLETRHGLCLIRDKKVECIVKILTVKGTSDAMQDKNEILMVLTLQQNESVSQQSPYFVQCLSSRRSKRSIYYAFEKCKENLNNFKKKFNDRVLLSLLECMISALLVLRKCGFVHGNLKSSNILYCKKLGEKYMFKTGDMIQVKGHTIQKDLQQLGLICKEKYKTYQNRTINLGSLVNELADGTINLDNADQKINQLSEEYDKILNQSEFKSRGIKQDFVQHLIKQSSTKIVVKDIKEFECLTYNYLSYRNKYQYYFMMSEIISSLKLNSYNVNCLRFACLSISHQAIIQSIESNSQACLMSLLDKERIDLENYLEKIYLQCEIYAMNLQLQGFDTKFIQAFLEKKNPQKLLSQALSDIIKEIISKNYSKQIQYENEDRAQIRALNYIFITNQMDLDIYDYKRLVLYLNSVDVPLY